MSTGSVQRLIGLSISSSPDLESLGYGVEHLREIMITIARSLLRLGGDSYSTGLAYGGGLRPGDFTWTLFSLARGEGKDRNGHPLYSYMAWPHYLQLTKEAEAELIHVCHFVRVGPPDTRLSGERSDAHSCDPAPDVRPFAAARCLTVMRERMTDGGAYLLDGGKAPPLGARIVLGGKLEDYTSIMPGLYEELLISRQRGVPSYVLGGFGGAAAVLAEAVLSPPGTRIPDELTLDWHLNENPGLADLVTKYAEQPGVKKIEETYQELSREVERARAELAEGGSEHLANGLTADENRALMQSEEELEIRRLLRLGLERVFESEQRDRRSEDIGPSSQ
jgi:hypothetical protein